MRAARAVVLPCQRVARALAHRSSLRLGGLARASLHDLPEETGATTLPVTHALDEAVKLADRVILPRGKIPEDLRVTTGATSANPARPSARP